MKDSISISTPIAEWTVLQQNCGFAEIVLQGQFSLAKSENYPVLRIVDTKTQKAVICKRVADKVENDSKKNDTVAIVKNADVKDMNSWCEKVSLPVGCYRIETGIALKDANHDIRYLARGQIISNIFVGEVFVVAGQSNAVGYAHAKKDLFDTPQYGVSCLKEQWQIATHPLGHFNSAGVTSDFLNSGHSPWLALGKMIFNHASMPVGFVQTALNGTNIDLWQEGEKLFENMIEKAKITNAKNLIWYQGCSDVFEGKFDSYEKKLDNFLRSIKKRLGEKINIYIVQISGTTNPTNPELGWRIVREAQRKLAKKHKTFLVPTYDLCDYSDDIHLGCEDNLILAERVFKNYLDKKVYSGLKIEKKQSTIDIQFSSVNKLSEKSIQSICVFDSNNQLLKSEVSLKDNVTTITMKDVESASFVSLSFGRMFDGNVVTKDSGEVEPYFYVDLSL